MDAGFPSSLLCFNERKKIETKSPGPYTKNGKWIFDRHTLDAYRESQMEDKDIEDRKIRLEAREILRRAGYSLAPYDE